MDKTEIHYHDSLKTILTLIENAQVKMVMAANSQLLWAYWQIGNELNERIKQQGWGSKVIANLSKDIRSHYPTVKGFSERNLLYMRQFAESYHGATIFKLNHFWSQVKTITQPSVALIESIDHELIPITQPAVAQLEESTFLDSILAKITWSHHLVLLDKCPNLGKRFWYMLNTLEYGTSKNILRMQIESGLFERQIQQKKINNFSATLPKAQSDFANYLLKDPYIFDFVIAKEHADERNIETQLTQHITKFLLELGQGFAFVGKQYSLKVGGNTYYPDLLFYHIKLRCYVVVELKARAFEPGDPSQLNFYLNVINDQLKNDQDQPSIGILLCRGKNEIVAEYALQGYTAAIGIADYQLSDAIPKNLRSTLPTIEDLENELQNLPNPADERN